MTPPLELTAEELQRITGYRQSQKQIEVLRSLGVPALLRPDNTVLVLRMHMTHPAAMAAERRPQLRSAR